MTMDGEFLGKIAYTAYGASTGFKTFRGENMLEWDEQPDRIKQAWVSAAKAVVEANG